MSKIEIAWEGRSFAIHSWEEDLYDRKMASEMEESYFSEPVFHDCRRLGDIDHLEMYVCVSEEVEDTHTHNVWDNWLYLWVHTSSKQASFPLQAYGVEVFNLTESSIRTMEKRNRLCQSLNLANKSFLHNHSLAHSFQTCLRLFPSVFCLQSAFTYLRFIFPISLLCLICSDGWYPCKAHLG